MEDEYGFDPDKNLIIEDNPFWDGTDAAHPAYWRGQDDASAIWAVKLTEWLDGKDDMSGAHHEPWQTIRSRIYALVHNGETDAPVQ